MKFVLTYTQRNAGSAAENVAGGEAAQKLLGNWTPSAAATIHQWVQRCDGNGGFSVLETDDAGELLKDLTTWSPWLEFQVYPVVDILDATSLTQDAINVAKAVV